MLEEIGKPRFEALTADVMPLLASLAWHARRAPAILRPRPIPGGGLYAIGQRQRLERRPLGRVAIIATWNYPIGLLGVQLAQAVIAGNRAVVKPSELAPRTQGLLLDLADRAAALSGLPTPTIERTSPTREAGRDLLAAGGLDHVIFTGSTEVGRAIAEILAPSLTTSTLELSGRDSALVLADADPRLAARSIWYAATANAGQTCMAPKRALVHAALYPAFLRELALLAAGAAPRRLIAQAPAREAADQLAEAVRLGGRPISGVLEPNNGPWLRPQAIADCPPNARLVQGRNFAPALAVLPCASVEAMLDIHQRVDQHLATSLFTRRPAAAHAALVDRLRVATVTINDCLIPTAHPATSIAGTGQSGWGRTQGVNGLLELTRPVTIAATSSLLRPPLDEPDPTRVASIARWLMRLHGAPTTPTKDPSTVTGMDPRAEAAPPAYPSPHPSNLSPLSTPKRPPHQVEHDTTPAHRT